MKSKYINLLFVFMFSILSCNRQINEKLPIFNNIENLIESNADSALILLNQFYSFVDSSQFNTAYYNILLSEANNKTNKLTLSDDSLLEYSIEYFKKKMDINLYSRALLNKGRLLLKMKQNKDALSYYYKLLDIESDISDYKTISKIYDDLGNLYISEGLYEESIQIFRKNYCNDSLHNNKDNMILSLTNIARSNLYLGKPEEYKKYMLKAYEIAHLSDDPKKNISYLDYLFSIYFIEISNYDEALGYITNSINIHYHKDDIFTKYLIKGEIFNAKNNYDSAYYYLNKSLETNKLYTKTLAYQELSLLHKSKNNFEKALEYTDLFQVGMDSITYLSFNTETQALAYRYNVDKAILKVNSENKIKMLIVIVVFSLFIMFFFILHNIRDKKIKLQNKEKEKEALKNKTEMLKKEVEITNLKREMDHLKNNISEYHLLESKLIQYNELIEIKESELYFMLNKDVEDQCDKFKKTKIYQKIIELSQQKKNRDNKILNYADQEELLKQIKTCFPRIINDLKEKYTFLNDEDMVICCLSIMKLSTYAISLCFAVSGANAIKQRKHRIKIKMLEVSEISSLYSLIFPKKK